MPGGVTGQALIKASNANGDVTWGLPYHVLFSRTWCSVPPVLGTSVDPIPGVKAFAAIFDAGQLDAIGVSYSKDGTHNASNNYRFDCYYAHVQVGGNGTLIGSLNSVGGTAGQQCGAKLELMTTPGMQTPGTYIWVDVVKVGNPGGVWLCPSVRLTVQTVG